ncbi:Prostaglandin E synthase 3 [Lemmus lemmus]
MRSIFKTGFNKRTDRSIFCCLWIGESRHSWYRLTKERAKLNWLSLDFHNWKDWEGDSVDHFSEMMGHTGCDEDVDLPEVDGADDDSQDRDDGKMPDLE